MEENIDYQHKEVPKTKLVEPLNATGVENNACVKIKRRGDAVVLPQGKVAQYTVHIGEVVSYVGAKIDAGVVDPKICTALIQKDDERCEVTVISNELQTFPGYVIKGVLRPNTILKKLGVNEDNAITLVELAKYLRLNYHILAGKYSGKAKAMELCYMLENYKAEANKSVQTGNVSKANHSVGHTQTVVNSTLPEDIEIYIDLFNDNSQKTLAKVELVLASNLNSVYLISPEINDLVDMYKKDTTMRIKEELVAMGIGCMYI